MSFTPTVRIGGTGHTTLIVGKFAYYRLMNVHHQLQPKVSQSIATSWDFLGGQGRPLGQHDAAQEEEEAHLSVMASGIVLILCTLVVAGALAQR